MAQKTRINQKYEHPLIWREGPEGLYPGPLFWMEGEKDLSGFQASVGWAYIKEKGTIFHPTSGMVTHPYDELLVFVSTNVKAEHDLGAEVSITLGEEQEVYTFHRSTIVCIPRGLPHGPAVVKSMDHAFVHECIGLSPEYIGEYIKQEDLPEPVPGNKYAHLVKDFRWYVDPVTGERIQDKYSDPAWWEGRDESDPGYGQIARWYKDVEEYRYINRTNLDCYGVSHPRNRGDKGPGNAENIIWMFGGQLEGFNVNTLFGHYTNPGIYHKAGESHSHPAEEIIVYVSLDADDPWHLGAECETALGEEDERYVTEVPVAYHFPRGFAHLPQWCRWIDRPYGFMIVELEDIHDSPWKVRDGSKSQYED